MPKKVKVATTTKNKEALREPADAKARRLVAEAADCLRQQMLGLSAGSISVMEFAETCRTT